MTTVSEDIREWLGLCRKPPAVHALQTGICILPEPTNEGLPDGGSGLSGTILRGIGSALSGMRTLNRNRQLLWFTLLAGLVLAGNAVGHAAVRYLNRTLQPDTIVLYTQDFILGFLTLLCLVFLLAGLLLSIPSRREGGASFFKGLSQARRFLKAIIIWSLALALTAMIIERLYVYLFTGFPQDFRFLYTLMDGFFVSTITQFPFNWTLDWNMLTEIPGYGGRSLLLLIYPFGFLETLHFSVIILILFALTPFVVPLIVLEQKTLREAVAGSFALIKKTCAEGIICALFLAVIVSGVFLASLLIQAISGIVDPYETVMFHPTIPWIVLAILYDIALAASAFIIATVAGIATLHIYISVKSGRTPGSPESKSGT